MKSRFSIDWTALILGLCFLASVVLGGMWFFAHYVFRSRPVNLFVELKVIDEKGHPVAGAQIFDMKENLGVTDSFGEWSRFVNALSGSKISLLIIKKKGKT